MKHPLILPAKTLAFLLAAFAFAHGARAQEVIALDEAQKIAQKLAEVPTGAADQPFTVDVDRDNPVGMKGGDAGLILLPDKHFNADSLANAGKTITPVAQMWTYRINLADKGTTLDKARLRTITVGDGDKTRDVQLFLVGVAKSEQGATELVIYGKGGEPVLRVPLTKHFAAKKEVAIDLSGRKTSDESATLALDFFGEYATELAVVRMND
jgi:hypothetical protein